MANAEARIWDPAEPVSGWCGGCGKRLEREDKKTTGFCVLDNGIKGLYLMCESCMDIVKNDKPGHDAILERVESRIKAHAKIGNAKGTA